MHNDYIFKTRVVNKDGTKGIAYVEDGMVLAVDKVTKKERFGTNPEELLGLSFATCLNATLMTLLKASNKDNESEVRVDVYLKRNKEEKKLYFVVDAFVEVKGMSLEEMTPFIETAEEKCPVSQLLSGNEHVSVKAHIFE